MAQFLLSCVTSDDSCSFCELQDCWVDWRQRGTSVGVGTHTIGQHDAVGVHVQPLLVGTGVLAGARTARRRAQARTREPARQAPTQGPLHLLVPEAAEDEHGDAQDDVEDGEDAAVHQRASGHVQLGEGARQAQRDQHQRRVHARDLVPAILSCSLLLSVA